MGTENIATNLTEDLKLQDTRKKSLALYYQKNKDKYKEWKRQNYLKNKEKILELRKIHYQNNRDRELARAKSRYEKDPSYFIQKARIRNYSILPQQTPSWADKTKITEFYVNCPEGHHVDHIIPLRGKTVSGLHIETNLQYLPATANLSKGNKW